MSGAAAPHRALGLTDAENAAIRERLAREPNGLELAVFSLMWSEHCAYKHSRKLLRQLPVEGGQVLMGPGENAGVVDVGAGLAVARSSAPTHPAGTIPNPARPGEPVASGIATDSNSLPPSAEPVSGFTACSGCGIRPSTFPSALQTPAMSSWAPFGF